MRRPLRFILMMSVDLSLLASVASGAGPTANREHPAVVSMTGASCVSCHGEILARRVMHGPAAAGDCAACHVVTTSAGVRRIGLKGNASGGNTAALCMACHTDIADRLQQAHRHAPGASGNRTACHDPHGS